jgi:hypothetical protein
VNVTTIFIAYRRECREGEAIARLLFNLLNGQPIDIVRGSLHVKGVVAAYWDRNQLAVPDWTIVRDRALAAATAFVLVCSPGASGRLPGDDELFREIDWWLANRSSQCPIVIAPVGRKFIPTELQERWPKLNFIQDGHGPGILEVSITDENVTKILRSVEHLAMNRSNEPPNLMADSGIGIISPPGLFVWQKDKNYRYTNCNEDYARAAGFDSPRAMLGKTDYDMPWRRLAEGFRTGDHHVISGLGPRVHVQEKEITADGEIPILVFERALTDRKGECVGLEGYFVDLTGVQVGDPPQPTSSEMESVCLGPAFDDQYLSWIEKKVFGEFLLTPEREKIAGALGIRKSEVEAHLKAIKWKLQCATDGDLTAAAMRSGLPLTLFGPRAKSGRG